MDARDIEREVSKTAEGDGEYKEEDTDGIKVKVL